MLHDAARRWLAGLSVIVLLAGGGALAQDDETCLGCHGDPNLTGLDRHDNEVSMYVGEDAVGLSSHSGMSCVECHVDLATVDDYPHAEDLVAVDCGNCHAYEARIYDKHGRVVVGEDEDVPSCAGCHGSHDILPSSDRASRVSPENLPKTCGTCHEDIDLTTKHEILYGEAIRLFKSSVHGRAISGGVLLAASCNDCHSSNGTAHRIYGPGDHESTINHFNIPKTCGRCHSSVEQEYWLGIHGKLVARGETDSPVCTNCHGEHGIIAPSDPRSPVSPTRVAEATCAPCHESASLNEKYDIPTGRLRSWYDSYHGLKSKAGDVTVANCASCHNAHMVLSSTDPASSVNTANLQHTCGECHPGITAAMANTPIHEAPGISQTPAADVVKNIYVVAILLIIGSMVVHWLVDLRRQIQLVRAKKQIRRMTTNETWQHTFLMVTFVVLVLTGFSLRYAASWWVDLMFGWEGGFPLRGIIHRVAAVLFIFATVWHGLYLTTARGRQFVRDMFPTLRDFEQFFLMIKYNLNLAAHRPRFGRFSYVEKAEYWALVWGTVVMILTGFFLWFDNVAVLWFPKGFLDVMLVIHYYEAWLASLAILVWHMYSTVFNPSVYPMNPSWIDGMMPLDVYRHEHPDDPALAQFDEAGSGDRAESTQPAISRLLVPRPPVQVSSSAQADSGDPPADD
ncbi:MAG TPA: cytochrome b/b6 domain-containing protein [Acidobacteriota bacterium]|nr:cytochrome b/b6 domain-containing protein [Acidobacteriota bacterium]